MRKDGKAVTIRGVTHRIRWSDETFEDHVTRHLWAEQACWQDITESGQVLPPEYEERSYAVVEGPELAAYTVLHVKHGRADVYVDEDLVETITNTAKGAPSGSMLSIRSCFHRHFTSNNQHDYQFRDRTVAERAALYMLNYVDKNQASGYITRVEEWHKHPTRV
jgi:hypothetical protein